MASLEAIPAVVWREQILPLLSLTDIFGLQETNKALFHAMREHAYLTRAWGSWSGLSGAVPPDDTALRYRLRHRCDKPNRRERRQLLHALFCNRSIDEDPLAWKDLIEWVFERVAFDILDVQSSKCLEMALLQGGTHKGEWLRARPGYGDQLQSRLHRKTVFGMLVNACTTGCFSAALLIHEWFHLSAKEVTQDQSKVLRRACRSGALDLVQWLVVTFKLTRKHIRAHRFLVLKQLCKAGHLNVVKWLSNTFELTGTEMCLATARSTAASAGHVDVVTWIDEVFPGCDDNQRLSVDSTELEGPTNP